MGGFRYLAVMISMVLGFGLSALCAGIGNLVQVRRRVKLYWLHSLWVVLLIILQAIGVGTFASCSASKNRRLHAVAIILIAVLLVIGITTDRVSLGQFKLRSQRGP